MALIYYAYKFFRGMCSPKDDVPQLSEQQQYDQHHQQSGPEGPGGNGNGNVSNAYPPLAPPTSYVSGGPDGGQPGQGAFSLESEQRLHG